VSAIDVRTLCSRAPWSIVATMVTDDDSRPGEADCYTPADVAAFNETWEYVGMHVEVMLDGVLIGEDGMYGIEHGHVANDWTVDAWEIIPSVVDGDVTVMGSPLAWVIDEALDSAARWLARNGFVKALPTVEDITSGRR